MKKALKWTALAVAIPILLIVLLAVLLYLPPVQNWAVKQVARVASEKTGMEITVEHVNLEFPLNLGVEGLRVLQPNDSLPQQKDTVADVRKLLLSRYHLVIQNGLFGQWLADIRFHILHKR